MCCKLLKTPWTLITAAPGYRLTFVFPYELKECPLCLIKNCTYQSLTVHVLLETKGQLLTNEIRFRSFLFFQLHFTIDPHFSHSFRHIINHGSYTLFKSWVLHICFLLFALFKIGNTSHQTCTLFHSCIGNFGFSVLGIPLFLIFLSVIKDLCRSLRSEHIVTFFLKKWSIWKRETKRPISNSEGRKFGNTGTFGSIWDRNVTLLVQVQV